MEWIRLKAACPAELLDEVSSVMMMLDSRVQTEDPADIDSSVSVYGELLDDSLKNADRSRGSVSIYVAASAGAADCLAFLRERLADIPGVEITAETLDEEDWAHCWKKYYYPTPICDNVTVVPTWESYTPAPDENIILFDPGMAFGSGTHETTRLCARLLRAHMRAGDRVLDVGCGSGILAITASVLGAAAVDAYDVDPVAVRVASENIGANGCPNVSCGVSDLLADVSARDYDFVCANIVADIIVRMAPDVGQYIKPGGLLAVSGVIDTQHSRVEQTLSGYGLRLAETLTDNDWVAMLFVNGSESVSL